MKPVTRVPTVYQPQLNPPDNKGHHLMRTHEHIHDPYAKLARYLDELPAGYPPTASGLERQILRKLFSEKEARLALHLTLIPEEARVIAFRAELPSTEAADILKTMGRKGLIATSHHPGKPPRYAISQFVVGFYEGQVNQLDRELVDLIEAYLPHYFENSQWIEKPQLRTIPVNQAIPLSTEVMPYENIEAILRAKDQIAVRNCICRQEQALLGQGCGNPLETCLTFNQAAREDAITGKGRLITLDEALGLIEQARNSGLVLQPANSKNPVFLCTCCSCCCGVLRQIKQHPHPTTLVDNAFAAKFQSEVCNDCGACLPICPMGALKETADGSPSLEAARCIGCGLCVGVCRSGALMLERKPLADQPQIPNRTIHTYQKIAQARGKWHPWHLVRMALRSAWHRLIARR